MKKLLALIVAVLLTVGSAYATNDPHNPVVESDDVVLTTTAITPFTITNVQPSNPDDMPDVIKGQKREFASGDEYQVFEIKKENGYEVQFDLVFAPYPVDGVTLGGSWLFYPGAIDLENISGSPSDVIPNSGQWIWEDTDDDLMTVVLRVDNIDATNATSTGQKTFTATMSGHYIGL